MSKKKHDQINIFEKNDIRNNKESFFTFMMQHGEEEDERIERAIKMDLFSRYQGETDVDTYACDCLFLRTFPTMDMLADFPEIAKDFLSHEYCNIPEYDQVEYISSTMKYDHPACIYINLVLNLMLNAAKQGNAYSIGLFQYLFQTYHKKEYKLLKRFRRITRDELMDVANSGEELRGSTYLPVLITMCRLYGIELDEDCYVLYKIFPDLLESIEEEEDIPEFQGFPEEIVKTSIERMKDEMEAADEHKPVLKRKRYAALKDSLRFVEEVEKWLGLPKGFVEDSDDEFHSLELQMLRTLQLLQSIDNDREYSFDEIQEKSVLLKAVSAICSYHDMSEESLERMLGLNPDKYQYEVESSLFHPEKVKIPSGTNRNIRGSGIVPSKIPLRDREKTSDNKTVSDAGDNGLQEELENLRARLKKQEQENQLLRDKNRELDLELKEELAKSETCKSEHEELVHLRDYVYQMTEDDQEIPAADVKEMEKALKDKKIVIIGGHSNWTYKLKNKFSKWVFFKPEISNTLDGRALDDADYIYFFTDILSHGTYGKYMKLIRSRGITSYGYIHSINIASNIRQIYDDVCMRE